MKARQKPKKDFLALHDYSAAEILKLITLARAMKKRPSAYRRTLQGKTLGMIFHKKSTRTRVSFEVGIYELGGIGLFFGPDDLQLARGEPISDTAKVLSRYLDGIMIRTFRHNDVVELARHATIPVINGLTDYNHPCQVLADLMTIQERFGKFPKKIAYVGDGNNMATSLLVGAAKVGMSIAIVCPEGYRPHPEIIEIAKFDRKNPATEIIVTPSIPEGVRNADVVYTDVWASMGQEAEATARLEAFATYQVNQDLMKLASPKAVFMHCLPAHRGEEVSADVIDSKQSIIYDQAENRLHAQKAILATLMH